MLLTCACLPSYATGIGTRFAQLFRSNSLGIGKGEIVLFRAMQLSLLQVANPPHIVVEEYHGSRHQVMFQGNGIYSRTSARCELSDLLVVICDSQMQNARITYIQAKSERSISAKVNGVAGSLLDANLEQWDLLARRPNITGVGRFRPPQNLLSGTQLASIGSFVFFLHGANGVDIQYASASNLYPPHHSRLRRGKLTAAIDSCQCPPHECLSVYGSQEFGSFLFGLMIGTPIILSGNPTTLPVGLWLAGQLRSLAAEATEVDQDTVLATRLANLLDPDRRQGTGTSTVGARMFMLFSVGTEESEITKNNL